MFLHFLYFFQIFNNHPNVLTVNVGILSDGIRLMISDEKGRMIRQLFFLLASEVSDELSPKHKGHLSHTEEAVVREKEEISTQTFFTDGGVYVLTAALNDVPS